MRDRILSRVREALADRTRHEHPGSAPPRNDVNPTDGDLAGRFEAHFRAAGGEVVRLPDPVAAAAWAASLAASFQGVSQSPLVPPELRVPLPEVPAEVADLGVSLALRAVAETGSLLLTSRGGRRLQLLPRTHLVWVPVDRLRESLEEALEDGRSDETGALALHSGPSKSADIGQIVVTGVHGPARVITGLLEYSRP